MKGLMWLRISFFFSVSIATSAARPLGGASRLVLHVEETCIDWEPFTRKGRNHLRVPVTVPELLTVTMNPCGNAAPTIRNSGPGRGGQQLFGWILSQSRIPKTSTTTKMAVAMKSTIAGRALAMISPMVVRCTRTTAMTTRTPRVALYSTIPRAAVSVCVRCGAGERPPNQKSHHCDYYYLLVQRGKEPNRGMWSFPGGKVEWGESTLHAAQRELREETLWSPTDWERLQWYRDGTIGTTDSIGEGYHYLIAHCLAHWECPPSSITGLASHAPIPNVREGLPILQAADDAKDAKWFRLSQIDEMVLHGHATPGIEWVIRRVEQLSRYGLLPT